MLKPTLHFLVFFNIFKRKLRAGTGMSPLRGMALNLLRRANDVGACDKVAATAGIAMLFTMRCQYDTLRVQMLDELIVL